MMKHLCHVTLAFVLGGCGTNVGLGNSDHDPSTGGGGSSSGGSGSGAGVPLTKQDYGAITNCNPISLTPWDFNGCGITLSMAYSPDGRFLVTGSYQQPGIHVWNVSDGTLVQEIDGPGYSSVYALAFSPDGKLLMATGTNGSPIATVYDFATLTEVQSFYGETDDAAFTAAFSHDGTMIAIGTFGISRRVGAVLVLEVSDWSTVSHLIYPVGVNHVHFSPTDASVLVGGADGRAYVYDTVTREEQLVINPIAEETGAATFSPDGHFLATTSQSNELEIHDASNGDLLQTKGHSAGIAVSPDLATLVVSTTDGNPDSGGFVFLSL
jgi:WD40 repeat protein